ncbi:hypothetical protein Y032_0846g2653, partial [Ancylostoma ceylanicum]
WEVNVTRSGASGNKWEDHWLYWVQYIRRIKDYAFWSYNPEVFVVRRREYKKSNCNVSLQNGKHYIVDCDQNRISLENREEVLDQTTRAYANRLPEMARKKPSKIKTLSSKIVTASNSAACGVWLEIGEEYLIGGSVDEKGVLHSYLCGTNQNWNDVSAKDKAALKAYQC